MNIGVDDLLRYGRMHQLQVPGLHRGRNGGLFFEGENMIVINTEECIDCGVCEPECPVDAIKPDTVPEATIWIEINQTLAEKWPNICEQGTAPVDADEWAERQNKLDILSEAPATRSH